ncbi:uncharacterized protein LOC126373540 [Pectinophora gossypiella]|uniref:uncharacterized protein LOC126373540 n=1 Tax=Pectinophora gossypiella TaxID=13191 RepID=UPI00214F1A56|nr:uncharacterized protein LOC126373540 [Pectinophora gossypiella]
MAELEWTRDLSVRLIQEYEKRPELWQPTHDLYRVQTLKYESWRELAGMFECDVADLRKKLTSLFASHRREKQKVRRGRRSTWFLYPHMSFLPSHLHQPTITREAADTRARAPKRKARVERVSSTESSEDSDDQGGASPVPSAVYIKQEREPDPPRLARRPGRVDTHKRRWTRPMKRRVVREAAPAPDSRVGEALKLLRRTRKKDECDSFGEYIADSLRKHDERTQSMIKQAINNILFEQEMKKYNAASGQYTVLIAGIDETPLVAGADATDR